MKQCTPDKAKRRPGVKTPSPVTPFKISPKTEKKKGK